jgi:hypothetical protein
MEKLGPRAILKRGSHGGERAENLCGLFGISFQYQSGQPMVGWWCHPIGMFLGKSIVVVTV